MEAARFLHIDGFYRTRNPGARLEKVRRFSTSVPHLKIIGKENKFQGINKKQLTELNKTYLNFVKAYISNTLVGVYIKDYRMLVDVIQEFDPDFRLSHPAFCNHRRRKAGLRIVQINPFILDFIDYINNRFPEFDKHAFLALQSLPVTPVQKTKGPNKHLEIDTSDNNPLKTNLSVIKYDESFDSSFVTSHITCYKLVISRLYMDLIKRFTRPCFS